MARAIHITSSFQLAKIDKRLTDRWLQETLLKPIV